jgi:hypothetical protein
LTRGNHGANFGAIPIFKVSESLGKLVRYTWLDSQYTGCIIH